MNNQFINQTTRAVDFFVQRTVDMIVWNTINYED